MNSRTLLAVPYRLSRRPLALVDAQIAHRLPEDSVPRLMFDRALGCYDQFAGRLLENPSVTQRGNDRIARAGRIADAVTLEREAAQRREAAAAAARDGHSAAAEKARQADQRAADGLREAQDIDREGKKAAAEDARSIAKRKKDQADERALDRTGAIEDDLEHTEAATNTRITAAQQQARDRLDEAAHQRSAAAGKRSDADQLGALAGRKRQNRKTS